MRLRRLRQNFGSRHVILLLLIFAIVLGLECLECFDVEFVLRSSQN